MARGRSRLMTKAKETKAYKEDQTKKRQKWDIEDDDCIVVEKDNTIVNLVKGAIRNVIIVGVLSMAFVGSVCLLYPGPRAEFFKLANETVIAIEELTGHDISKIGK